MSEGLTGRFVKKLFANPPEPWERAVDREALCHHFPSDEALASVDYHHAAWFFGTGGIRPRWLGYAFGYEIVGSWLAGAAPIDGPTWIGAPAEVVLSAGKKAFRNGQ